MQEHMTKIEIPMSYKPHSSSMRTLVAKTSPHVYRNENIEQ
jgi:hypothetical protein